MARWQNRKHDASADMGSFDGIGIPVLFNAVLTTCLWLNVTRAELRRVEEMLDARLKHLEER